MFDARLRRHIDGPLNAAGRRLAGAGVSADQVTLIGFAFGILAAIALAFEYWPLGLVLFIAGRLADGLDGAIARATNPTDRGGFLDIVLDFVVYGAIPLAFAIADPIANAVAASVLLFSFLCNGSAFLAYAIMAEKRGLTTSAQGLKSLFYLAGLAEGGETVLFFMSFCLFPSYFAWLAYGFAALCFLSAFARTIIAWRTLKP